LKQPCFEKSVLFTEHFFVLVKVVCRFEEI
jgi:hypothetical protein